MKIKLCPTCNGEGKYHIEVGTHNLDYEEKFCKRCNGTGRIIETDVKLTAEIPFDKNNKNKLYEWNSKLFAYSKELKEKLNIKE